MATVPLNSALSLQVDTSNGTATPVVSGSLTLPTLQFMAAGAPVLSTTPTASAATPAATPTATAGASPTPAASPSTTTDALMPAASSSTTVASLVASFLSSVPSSVTIDYPSSAASGSSSVTFQPVAPAVQSYLASSNTSISMAAPVTISIPSS